MAHASRMSGDGLMQVERERASRLGTSDNGLRARTLVISNIRLLREGVALAIRQDGRLEVMGAVDAVQAPIIAAKQTPDVVLLDGSAAGGSELPRLLKELIPHVPIVVFAITDGNPDILGWAKTGMSGYVGCDGSMDDIAAAVEGALRGEVFCSPKLTALLFARVAQLSEVMEPGEGLAKLTPREREIMTLVEQGLPNKEIARRLGIGYATVKNHVHHVLEKLNVGRRGEAVAQIRRNGEEALVPNGRSKRQSSPG